MYCIHSVVFFQALKDDYSLSGQVASIKGKCYIYSAVCSFRLKAGFCSNLFSLSIFYWLSGFFVHKSPGKLVFLPWLQVLIGNCVHQSNLFICFCCIGVCLLIHDLCADFREMDGLIFFCDVCMFCDQFFLLIEFLEHNNIRPGQFCTVKSKRHFYGPIYFLCSKSFFRSNRISLVICHWFSGCLVHDCSL